MLVILSQKVMYIYILLNYLTDIIQLPPGKMMELPSGVSMEEVGTQAP